MTDNMSRVKVLDIIKVYSKSNIFGVELYLKDKDLTENTWVYKIRQLIDKQLYQSAIMEIELVAYKFKYLNKNETR